MKIVGLVHWAERDKRGLPIAGVRPLVEIQKTDWRAINAVEEFPPQGLVFWPNAAAAVKDSLIVFRAEPNAGPKDEFRVADAKPAYEVLDLRRCGTTAEVRAALVEGVPLAGPFGTVKALIWCTPDVLVGPAELHRGAKGTVKLVAPNPNLSRMATYTATQIRKVLVEGTERLLRVDDAPPSGYVDWDDEAVVLRRALEIAVRVAKQASRDIGQTKKQIEEAARALASQVVGQEVQLDRYRLERALHALEHTDVVTRNAGVLAELLREHPAIKVSLAALSASVRADVERSARAELDQLLARERAALEEANAVLVRAQSEIQASKEEIRTEEGKLAAVRAKVDAAEKEAITAVDARVLAVLERPLDLLAQVSVLRPFFGGAATWGVSAAVAPTANKLEWSRARGEQLKDRASLRRSLTAAARSKGVDPAVMIQIHGAVVARLMPITLGPGALAALVAYAQGACGARVMVLHVSPRAIHPNDFDELPGGGLVAAASAAKAIDGISLVVLEGANRSPLEASFIPLLQLTDVGLSPLSSASGLRLCASLVAGATTVPVTSQLWSHAVAIYAEPHSPTAPSGAAGEVALSSELLVPGDEPTAVIDALLETWPDCRELRPAITRLGSAFARINDDESRLAEVLLHGLVLPYVATALTAEERSEAVGQAGDADGAIARTLRRLRKGLA